MKNLVSIIAFVFIAFNAFAQDTLVNTEGVIIPAYIVAADSEYYSYRDIDTTINEIHLQRKDKLLMVKHSNGSVEKFYKNDTLITTDGRFTYGKVLEISEDFINYFSYSGNSGAVKMIPTSSVFSIHLSNGDVQLMDKLKVNSTAVTISDEEYYQMGKVDATKYFKTASGAIVGEVVSGVFIFFYGLPVISAIIIAEHAPENLHNSSNPNDKLLISSKSYNKGFTETASKKKSKDCWKAFGCGTIAPLAVVAIVIMAIANNGFF
ncbi:hypothetical protein BH09BAC5_BH09BAC5_17930 [soil metagenome]